MYVFIFLFPILERCVSFSSIWFIHFRVINNPQMCFCSKKMKRKLIIYCLDHFSPLYLIILWQFDNKDWFLSVLWDSRFIIIGVVKLVIQPQVIISSCISNSFRKAIVWATDKLGHFGMIFTSFMLDKVIYLWVVVFELPYICSLCSTTCDWWSDKPRILSFSSLLRIFWIIFLMKIYPIIFLKSNINW